MNTFFRLKFLWIVLLLLGLLLFSCISLWINFPPALTTSTPSESALAQTRELLSIIAVYPVGPPPDDLPGYLRTGEDCWALLQQNMRKNNNEYKLYVTSEYDSNNDPQAGREMTEVWLDIEFPDSQIIQMYSYQGGLNLCRKK